MFSVRQDCVLCYMTLQVAMAVSARQQGFCEESWRWGWGISGSEDDCVCVCAVSLVS